MDELAQQAVGRLRITLASGLNSLVASLGEQFRVEGSVQQGKQTSTRRIRAK